MKVERRIVAADHQAGTAGTSRWHVERRAERVDDAINAGPRSGPFLVPLYAAFGEAGSVRTGDLMATLAVVLLVAIVMIAITRRKRRRSVDRRALVEEFLKSHPGPVELRSARGTLTDPIVVTAPDADRVLELLGRYGGEIWIVRHGQGAAFIHVPGWGERR